MNAIPMLVACFTRQAYLTLWSRCECGEPIPAGSWRCATCAVRVEIQALERWSQRG